MPPLLIPARNASEWTGPAGNNTWLLLGPAPALVDAGVGHPDHLADIERALGDASLARVFVTHRHSDHVKGLPALLARWPDAAVVDATHLADEGGFPAGSTTLRIIPTPGHAPDHLCFFDHESGDLYGGDLVRLEGSIVIPASQRGNLRDYLASLRRVRDLHPRRLLPGHGPIVDDPIALIDQYIAHREMRDQQILAAIASGARTTEEIVDRVYPGLPATLKRAAADTVEAHLEKLKEEGKV
jgi:glyoxylase-like metal-dependent hydrolase (beta-lactamase superfamily II)